ncbi:unnamed protein product [Rhizophagus irregularis]|uniref:Uncharacterized protein n=1 Tax=Rhizophagus irregularis TaxID=588596 RepID=A0A2I1GHL5_9GLOM|nr:hypothetical protein RhiirA4_460916 [Rhizophagus irregularis]CAB4444056.1 unnamed protein product [Rhizophagus irregularis]
MAYVECKIWPFSISLYDYDIRSRVMKECRMLDKLGIKYNIPPKDSPFYDPNVLGYTNLELSFRYKGEGRLVSGSDDTDFEVVEEPKADLVLGLQWLWLRETKIDI